MKRLLWIVAIIWTLCHVTVGPATACRSCLIDCFFHTNSLEDLKEPARSISLGLWFGAYSADKYADCTERKLTPHLKPDETSDLYFRFWNRHAPHVPKAAADCEGRKYLPDVLDKMVLPIPDKGNSLFVHVARHDLGDDEYAVRYSFDRLSMRSKSDDKEISASMHFKLFRVGLKVVGGKLEGGWGISDAHGLRIVMNKTVTLGGTEVYDLNVKQYIDGFRKKAGKTEESIGFVLQVDEVQTNGATAPSPCNLILIKRASSEAKN